MKEVYIVPYGWPCTLDECPPGLFLSSVGTIGFKSQYPDKIDGELIVLCYNLSGVFHSHSKNNGKEIVQPLIVEGDYEEDDE